MSPVATVPCRECGAARGVLCVSDMGGRRSVAHQSRVDDAERASFAARLRAELDRIAMQQQLEGKRSLDYTLGCLLGAAEVSITSPDYDRLTRALGGGRP